jgi:predicted transcriptional regulator
MPKKFTESELKEQFKKVPTPVKQKVVQDLVTQDYTQKEIAEMFGVSAMMISKLANAEINDELLKKLDNEVERLNKMKDVQIKAVVKDLELSAYKKLQENMGEAKYGELIKTAEMFRNTSGGGVSPQSQTNIQIVMPDSVKKKFNLVQEEPLEQPLI